MLNAFASQRCFNHALREADLRCPGCKRYYCRECASEHDGRYLCVSCLKAASVEAKKRRNFARPIAEAAIFVAAIFVLWESFYVAGYAIMQMPAATHDAQNEPWDTAE